MDASSAPLLITNGAVITGGRVLYNKPVLIEDKIIACVGGANPPRHGLSVDAGGCFVSAGFIDCHIHGDPLAILRSEVKHGTTAIVAAQSCAPLTEIYAYADTLRHIADTHPLGKMIAGFRIEGPYISLEKSGAQDIRYIHRPDAEELKDIIHRCAPLMRIMTIAPELKGARTLIRVITKNKIIASLGHSYATDRQARSGIDAGIRHATHVFNAMRGKDACGAGAVGAVLADKRVFAEVILDLIHVHEALFGRLLRAKGFDKVILITDSVRSERRTGVRMARGAYRFKDGKLAGSALTMIDAVKNAVERCGLSIAHAVRLATLNPARFLGIAGTKGSIAAGKDADIVIFDKNFDVKMTIVRGKIIYQKKGFNTCAA